MLRCRPRGAQEQRAALARPAPAGSRVAAHRAAASELPGQLRDGAAAGRIGQAGPAGEGGERPGQQLRGEGPQRGEREGGPGAGAEGRKLGGEAPLDRVARSHGGRGEAQRPVVDGRTGCGQQPVAEPVAGRGEVAVGGVVHGDEARLGDGGRELRASQREERPHERPAPGRHRSQPCQARAEQQAQQHGLDLVVRVVRGEQPAGPALVAQPLEQRVAQAARRGLATARLARLRREARPCAGGEHHDIDLDLGREAPGRFGPGGGPFVQPMVDVRGEEAPAARRRELAEAEQQRSGVGPAGEGGQEQVAGRRGRRAAAGAETLVQRLEQPSPVGEGSGGGDGTRTHDLAVMSRSL